jgi:hypothetical protein
MHFRLFCFLTSQDKSSISAPLGAVSSIDQPVDVHFLCLSHKENEPKEKAKSKRRFCPPCRFLTLSRRMRGLRR